MILLCHLYLASQFQGEYTDAAALYERAAEVWENALGADHPTVATVLGNRAVLSYRQVSIMLCNQVSLKVFHADYRCLSGMDTRSRRWLFVLQVGFARLGMHGTGQYSYFLMLKSHVHAECDGLNSATRRTKHRQESHDTAIQFLERALSIQSKKLGEDHQDTVNTQKFLELVRRRKGVHEAD